MCHMEQPYTLQHEISAYIFWWFEHYNIIHAIYGLIGSSHPHFKWKCRISYNLSGFKETGYKFVRCVW